MRLNITDHAFLRMGDWHPEFRQFVPKRALLDFRAAQGVMNGLHIFVSSLENGRPTTRSEKARQRQDEKYRHVTGQTFFIFDRPLRDLYTLVAEDGYATLVTVTAIKEQYTLTHIDDPHPPARFEQVDELHLPYILEKDLIQDPEFQSLRTPAGRFIRILYSVGTGRSFQSA